MLIILVEATVPAYLTTPVTVAPKDTLPTLLAIPPTAPRNLPCMVSILVLGVPLISPEPTLYLFLRPLWKVMC